MSVSIDHIGLSVSDYAAAKTFYTRALAPIGISVLMEFPASVTGDTDVCGLGADGKPFFWIAAQGRTSPHTHVAFAVESRKLVDDFYAAAMAAGGKDNGAPGVRPHYHADYYGAFVLDADGNNIEAVCHRPE